ncbi:MAG: C25 family cysteine peptidase [Desulfobacteraceae bacterium]|nr:C25 family cysteine peptidase [Desulfobacteraceae bacterium]
MKRFYIYLILGLILAAVVVAYLWLQPSQAEKVTVLRTQSKKYLVITRDRFVDGLAPWRARRERQGFEVKFRSWSASPEVNDIERWIQQEIKKSHGQCRYILLVGDCAGPGEEAADWHLPTFIGPTGYPYEKDKPLRPMESDAPFGDIDHDGQMEVAVGRLPVRNEAQLAIQLAKIVEHEERPLVPSYYRAVLWTGAKDHHDPMYQTTLQYVENLLPDGLYPYVISSYPDSACSGPLTEQPSQFLNAVAQPAFISMVVGHGDYNNLRCAEINHEEIRMMVDSVAALPSTAAVGPLLLLACEAGTYNLPTAQGPSMAEAFLNHPGGPVAVVAAAGNLNVLTNFYLAGSIAHNIQGRSTTIGDLLVDSRQILYKIGKYTLAQIRAHDPRTRELLGPPQEDNQDLYEIKNLLRNESLLYNLLGDPCLALNLPKPLRVQMAMVGEHQLHISGIVPPEADHLWIEQFDLNRLKVQAPPDATDEQRRQLFQEANQAPRLLANQLLKGPTWLAEITLTDEQMVYGSKIRVMAIGGTAAYAHTIAMPVQ